MQVKDDATVLINSRTSQQPAPRPAVPEVPPGLGLEQASGASTASSGSSQASPPAGPTTMVLNVLDSVAVTFGPGFAVKEVVTGFESRTVILKNIPTRVTAAMISQALSPFGEVTNVHIPEKRFADSNMLVKATFVDHTHAAAASTALDGARLFNTRIGVRLASHQSTSLGKGTVRDGDVFLEFPAPCRDAFVGYSSLDAAMSAVRFAHGAEMGQSILSASIYQGVPVIGAYNVKFCALPPDVVAAELDVFGPNEGVMLGRCNYPSLDDSLKELQARLEIYGELISVKVLAPPFANQTVRAWAHFSTPSAADEACRGLNGRRPCFLGLGRIVAKHSMSITYSLPKRVFDSLAANIRHLRSCVHTAIHCCDIVIRAGPKDQTGSVGVKLTAETLSTLTKLKTSFEGILRGETVRFDRRAAWDSFFARASGAAFIAALEATYPEVMIKVDLRRSLIRLFGPHSRTWRVRQAIQEQMEKLSAQKTHSLPLDGNLVGLVVNPDLLKLQQELGTGNVYIDSRTLTLKVRGNKDAVQVASLIIQQARRRRHQLAGKQIANGCPICLDKVSLPITLDCGHTWCKRCLTSYLLAAIDTKVFPLNCLGDGAQCSNQIPISIVRRILTSEDFQRLAHASFLAYIHSRPSEFHYCPTPDCVQVYRSAPRDTVLQCPSCLIRICPNCHVEYHEGTKCPDSETEELRLFEEWTSTRDVKRCPGCKTYIERDAGCNHMECTRCRTHICWVCLETFPQGNAVYDHMRAVHGGIGL
ncbi:hypothetical protein BC835DRAFT_1408725 [Cytidiella melzeri]|nr:hypothetical protein BC835DRAFT_1408725 [Cytidiella melzeri]